MMPLKKRIISTITILLVIFLEEGHCYARAGGGGGGGGGFGGGGFHGHAPGGYLTPEATVFLVALIAMLIAYASFMTYIFKKKRNEAKILLAQLAKKEHIWNQKLMIKRIKEVFLKVQEAWMARDQDLAKDYMSKKIYLKHKEQTDQLIAEGKINVLDRIVFIEAVIFSVSDFKDDSLDTFSVRITASMADYMIDEKTNKIISGDKFYQGTFEEIWKFIRESDNWVLDEIDSKISMFDIISSKAFREKNNGGQHQV